MTDPVGAAELDALLSVPYTYVPRPRPVSADVRPLWRVPYVLLLVRACRGSRATLSQLHVLNWAVRSSDNAETLRAFLDGQLQRHDAVVRYEPALDRAVSLAAGLELLRFDGRLWGLEPSGHELVELVDADDELLTLERSRLVGITGLTQSAVNALLRRA